MPLNNMVLIATVFVIFAASSSSRAQAELQFDLVCTGTKTTMSDTTPFQGVKGTFQKEWAIDLNQGAFCATGCHAPSKIANVSDADIVLWDDDEQQFADKGTFVRSTGEFQSLKQLKGSLYSEMVVAHCVRTRFKGLPAK